MKRFKDFQKMRDPVIIFNEIDPYGEEDWSNEEQLSKNFNDEEIKLLNKYGYETRDNDFTGGNHARKIINRDVIRYIQKNKISKISKSNLIIPFEGKEIVFKPGTRSPLKRNKFSKETDLLSCIMDLEK